MKQFKTLLKVKTYEEISKIEELDKVDEEIYEVKENIQYIEEEIEGYKATLSGNISAFEHMSSRAIINTRIIDLDTEKKILLQLNQKREEIFNTLSDIRKEIKSIERLLEKKKEEQRIQELYKEQEMLDELNTLEC